MKKAKDKFIITLLLDNLFAYTLTALISGIVGGLVAIPIILLNNDTVIFLVLFKSIAVGAVIGIIARTVFNFILKNIRLYTLWSFFSLFIIIGIGTFSGAYILGERNSLYIAIMIIFAEIIGLAIAFYLYRYAHILNKSLEKVQQRFRK
jgi:uncharacterized membrane protein